MNLNEEDQMTNEKVLKIRRKKREENVSNIFIEKKVNKLINTHTKFIYFSNLN